MILVGIDIGKNKHTYCLIDDDTGEQLIKPCFITNNEDGFKTLLASIKLYSKKDILIGMEDTGHYHFNLLKYLLDKKYTVALINPTITDHQRKISGSISKNDKLDTITICEVLACKGKNKPYRISKFNSFDSYEMKRLTRHHHDLKEEYNTYANKLQKCIDILFPEFNSLFDSKYGKVYMSILKHFGSARSIASSDIRSIRKYFENLGRGKRIKLTAEKLKEAAKKSVGISSLAEEIEIKHLVDQIELVNEQLREVDKKIEEYSKANNSPILSIPGISHFSGTSILAEIGDINNFNNYKQIIKYAGVAPIHYESGQFNATHTRISKKGSKYLRKTLYEIITPVIKNNKVFKDYYNLKKSQGKTPRCAQGHCVRKLLRIIFNILTNNVQFDPSLLR